MSTKSRVRETSSFGRPEINMFMLGSPFGPGSVTNGAFPMSKRSRSDALPKSQLLILSPALCIQRDRDKPRLALNNFTAGVREREEANRTRVAGSRDEVEGVVATSLVMIRSGAVGFIDWLDGWRGNLSATEDMMVNVQICQHRCRCQTDREDTVAGWRTPTAVCVQCPRCANQAAAEHGEQKRMDEK